MVSKEAIVNALRREILSLGGIKTPSERLLRKQGLPAIKDHFPLGLFPTACVHEFRSTRPEQLAASSAFIAAAIHACLPGPGPLVWINSAQLIFPPALFRLGLDPEKIIFINPANEKEAGWCIEEALQCGSLAAVVADLQNLDFTNSRRFQLAVEKSRTTCFILHTRAGQKQATAAVARWQIDPLPSWLPAGMPGVGFPSWKVQLQKIRNGRPGSWELAWVNRRFELVKASEKKEIFFHQQTG